MTSTVLKEIGGKTEGCLVPRSKQARALSMKTSANSRRLCRCVAHVQHDASSRRVTIQKLSNSACRGHGSRRPCGAPYLLHKARWEGRQVYVERAEINSRKRGKVRAVQVGGAIYGRGVGVLDRSRSVILGELRRPLSPIRLGRPSCQASTSSSRPHSFWCLAHRI